MFCVTEGVPAALITSLYNTGVDDTGTVLPNSARDPHYSLVAVPPASGLGSEAYIADGPWSGNSNETSKWIAPVAAQTTFLDANQTGVYVYRTTFDLTGFDPLTAVLNGRWRTDNLGDDILINGVSTGITHGNHLTFYEYSSFVISSNFSSGINTLDFVVNNLPLGQGYPPDAINPTGLIVEITGTADFLTPIPEPASVAVWSVLAMVGIGVGFRRRRRN